jgi:hypothetical protein
MSLAAVGREKLRRVSSVGSQNYVNALRPSSQYLHRLLSLVLFQLLLFQLPNPLLQELPLWFLLGQRQSFLIRGPSLSCPAKPAVHIRTR